MLGRLCHWGPLLALSIIITLFLCGFYCTLLWFPPWTSLPGMCHVVVYCSWLCFIVNYFLKAICLGPGYLPLQWRADDKKAMEVLQFCVVCNGYKAPRAHHCSKCERCVLKMDHHCPWINTCVGHLNHRSFTLFLCFVPFGCTHATLILVCTLVQQFYLMSESYYQRILFRRNALVPFYVYHLVFILFCVGLSVGVTIAVGLLLYYQIKGILTNKTAIEAWIVEKADLYRPDGMKFTYPYHLGWKANVKQVICLWQDYVGDGISWPVIEGCDQYTLTREQLQQKQLKRERSVWFSVVKPYNGSLLPWREGIRTCLATPWTDEPRMKLKQEETVLVTRQRKFWLYGEKSFNISREPGIQNNFHHKEKGWFPRHCAVEVIGHYSPKKDI